MAVAVVSPSHDATCCKERGGLVQGVYPLWFDLDGMAPAGGACVKEGEPRRGDFALYIALIPSQARWTAAWKRSCTLEKGIGTHFMDDMDRVSVV